MKQIEQRLVLRSKIYLHIVETQKEMQAMLKPLVNKRF